MKEKDKSSDKKSKDRKSKGKPSSKEGKVEDIIIDDDFKFDEASSIDEERFVIINNIEQPSSEPSLLRSMTLYGDLTEEKGSEIVQSLMFLKDHAHPARDNDESSDEIEEETLEESKSRKSMSFLISTNGGTASEMFAIYDTINLVKETCDVNTVGMGKVMSAGVLLLAAGTKGKREIGANCRVMIHSVNGGYHGSFLNMENEISEVRWIQSQYVKCLAAETNLSEKRIRKFLKKNVDVYLSAEEAIEHGIADVVI